MLLNLSSSFLLVQLLHVGAERMKQTEERKYVALLSQCHHTRKGQVYICRDPNLCSKRAARSLVIFKEPAMTACAILFIYEVIFAYMKHSEIAQPSSSISRVEENDLVM